jgi:hypothetical protein
VPLRLPRPTPPNQHRIPPHTHTHPLNHPTTTHHTTPQVLELVAAYRPASEGEVYDIMNALEDRMGQVNSAVVMAAVKVFLHLTLAMPATHQQVGGGSCWPTGLLACWPAVDVAGES